MHAGIVLSQNSLDFAPLFSEIADAYYEREMYAEARPIYEMLGADAGVFLSWLAYISESDSGFRRAVCISSNKLLRVGGT